MKYVGHWITLIAVVSVFTVAIPWVAQWLELTTWLEWAQTLLSWPPLLVLLVGLFVDKFKEPLGFLIKNLAIKLPGGTQIQAQVEQPEDRLDDGTVVLSAEQHADLSKAINALQEEHDLSVAGKAKLVQDLSQVALERQFWEFKYLDLFLVPKTKMVLYQIGVSNQPSLTTVLTALSGESEEERHAIIKALLQTSLIVAQGERVHITNKGVRFLQFVNLIPPTPAV